MASMWQLKHHARFHAAVLRHFFPSSSPCSNTHQEAPDLSQGVSLQVKSLESTELAIEKTHSGHENEEVEAGKALLFRAQRKRLKMKKGKESQANALQAKRFVGPLLPHLLEKRRLESDGCNSSDALLQENTIIEKSRISPRDEQVFEDMGKPEILSIMVGEELAMAKIEEGTTREELTMAKTKDVTPLLPETVEKLAIVKTEEALSPLMETGEGLAMEATTLHSETGEGKISHDNIDLESLSKGKRRRLAKKKFHGGVRHPTAGSSFTAEINGGDIIIKQIL